PDAGRRRGGTAVGDSLVLDPGPGRVLTDAAAALGRVPVVGLAAGGGTGKDHARAVAALFAVGALGNPNLLAAEQPARPIDIWREQIFITNPCQSLPRRPASPAQPRPAGPAQPSRALAPGATPGTRQPGMA